MEKPQLKHKLILVIIYSMIAISFSFIGQENTFAELLRIPSFYTDLLFSFTLTFLVAIFTHWHNKKLYSKYDLPSEWKKVIIKQLSFGVLIPSFMAMILETIYLQSIGISFFESSILNLEFPLSLLFLILINLVYNLLYLFQLKQTEPLKEEHLPEKTTSNKLNFILVQFGAKEKQIPIEDCAYLFTSEKMIWLQTYSNAQYRIQGSLDEWETKLVANNFYRINRQVLSAFTAIKSVEQTETRRLKVHFTIDTLTEIYISKSNIAQFRKWWNQ